MTRLAIKVEGLSKEYVLGGEVTEQMTFREMLMGAVTEPMKRLRRLQGRSTQQERFWALKDVNFTVNEGEVVGIIGANGAGKSTLLKLLSRITAPTKGQIQYRGRIASLLEVGTGFHPELSGRENIFINGAILGMTRNEIRKRFDEIVEFAGIGKFLDTPVKRYSSGMYVRLAFAVAAHLDTDILIVDEVLAVGDAEFQKKCLNKMEYVSNQGRTVLFVSHNMASIKRLCDSGILLESGNIIAVGSPHDIVSKYYKESCSAGTNVVFEKGQHKTDSDFVFQQLELLGLDEHGLAQYHSHDDIPIKLCVRVARTFLNARIGIEIYREGMLLANFVQDPTRYEVSDNLHEITCNIAGGMFMPGYYDIHVGAYDYDTGSFLDWIPDAFSFQILDVHADEDQQLDNVERGVVRVPAKWL